jgi:general transcription factor 3C polypeptide 3 (transcription factor C subunit 4)
MKEQGDISRTGSTVHASLFEETPRSKGRSSIKPRKLTPAQVRELEEQKEKEVVRGYKRLEGLWPKLLNKPGAAVGDRSWKEAEREWMFEAEKLVEMFRETRMLFLSTRVGLPCEPFHCAPYRSRIHAEQSISRDDPSTLCCQTGPSSR